MDTDSRQTGIAAIAALLTVTRNCLLSGKRVYLSDKVGIFIIFTFFMMVKIRTLDVWIMTPRLPTSVLLNLHVVRAASAKFDLRAGNVKFNT